MIITFATEYVETTYNPRLRATVPGCWKAYLMEDINVILGNPDWYHNLVEGIGCTEENAIKMMVGQLKSLGLSGKLRKVK